MFAALRSTSLLAKFSLMIACLCLGLSFSKAGVAQSATITIVALGGSNTYGKGVSRHDAYPAQLEAMLRTKGYNARVLNAGVNGDTTSNMLARLGSAVPDGTSVVILQPGGNDRRKGVQDRRKASLAAIKRRLNERGIKLLMLRGLGRLQSRYYQSDGMHLTSAGYRMTASRLLPQVIAAIGHAHALR